MARRKRRTSGFAAIPVHMKANNRAITCAVIGAGALFLVYYVLSYWRLHRRGYRVSPQKVFLLATTGLCSLVAWGFNSSAHFSTLFRRKYGISPRDVVS